MARYVSFLLLLAVTVLLTIAFFRVMAVFLVPLFLACLLVVIFHPINDRLRARFLDMRWLETGRRASRLAALVTTVIVGLLVLVPLAVVVLLAIVEARHLVAVTSKTTILDKVKEIRTSLNLDIPAADGIRSIEEMLLEISANSRPEELEYQRQLLFEVEDATRKVGEAYGRPFAESSGDEVGELPPDETAAAPPEGADAAVGGESELASPTDSWDAFCRELTALRQTNQELANQRPVDPEVYHDYQTEITELASRFQEVKFEKLLGSNGWLKELANPSDEQLEEYGERFYKNAGESLLRFGSASTGFLISLVIGTAIMILAFYFFLVDGTAMINSLKSLSPLDDLHEQELIDEFSRISRAVVLATLLSAACQGLLAGIGYYFAGLPAVWVLTLVTGCLAMVPFVGAVAVWAPCALYLYLGEGHTGTAIGLAIYGMLVVSMADNVIKPLVLHGQSNLHPLLAFLSVIGGVGALGPIGILIGPMVVAFFQTILGIFSREVQSLDLATARGASGQSAPETG